MADEQHNYALYRIQCPVCRQATNVFVYNSTVLLNYPLHCNRCRQDMVINLVKLKTVLVRLEST